MAHPAAEKRHVPSDDDDARESASRRAAANAAATVRDVASARRRRPGDDQTIPPETGGDYDPTNYGGNRLARARLANPRCRDPVTPPVEVPAYQARAGERSSSIEEKRKEPRERGSGPDNGKQK